MGISLVENGSGTRVTAQTLVPHNLWTCTNWLVRIAYSDKSDKTQSAVFEFPGSLPEAPVPAEGLPRLACVGLRPCSVTHLCKIGTTLHFSAPVSVMRTMAPISLNEED